MTTLPEAVTLLADAPTVENRSAFIRALLTSELGAPLPAAMHGMSGGTHRADGSENFAFPNTTGPDGSTMILTWCDIPELNRQSTDKQYFAVDARVVLQMAFSNKCGIIVQCQTGSSPTWAGLTTGDVAELFASSSGT